MRDVAGRFSTPYIEPAGCDVPRGEDSQRKMCGSYLSRLTPRLKHGKDELFGLQVIQVAS